MSATRTFPPLPCCWPQALPPLPMRPPCRMKRPLPRILPRLDWRNSKIPGLPPKDLDVAINAFLAKPDEAGLKAARAAWIRARVPYPHTEVYRFGNPVVDDWEGRVNSWPLDEGLIGLCRCLLWAARATRTRLFTANVIANTRLTVDGKPVDASTITPDLLAKTLHKAGGVDANVAIGYHAIEFLLWGQDLNGTGPGGRQPARDGL